MGLSIPDIIALAKAGYKPSDVKELISLADAKETSEDQKDQKSAEEPQKAEGQDAPESAEAEKQPEKEEAAEKADKDDVNYKELYEKSQNDLKAAQEANRKQDASGNAPGPSESLKSIIASYL